jgi:hypothetical protein
MPRHLRRPTALHSLANFLLLFAVTPVLAQDSPFPHREEEAGAKLGGALARKAARVQPTATPNQALYDVHHYDLDLALHPSIALLLGTVTVRAHVTSGPISTLDLDLDMRMSVTAATAGGSAATWSHASDLLTVNLDRSYATGEEVVVAVTYGGDPSGNSWGWATFDGQEMIWTLSEPYGAREWWPCKDTNEDKADSVDIRVSVPSHLDVVSNGLLEAGGGPGEFHWKTRYPIAPYLVSLAIHPYSFYNDWYTPLGGGDPMEVQFWVFPSYVTVTQPTYALTVPMIETFAQGFGEYPFLAEKYGHANFVWGGGMEHQTCSSLGGWSEDLVSHELAHQWWGDLVTCADFSDIWLNEGFATWCEAYWREQRQGPAVYRQYMNAAAYYGPGTITVENPSDFGAIFNVDLSYNKGSWVVHMLRGVLGDSDFFAGLAEYRARHGYGSATTADLRDAMEFFSGRDLDAFFQQWIYGEYYPEYRTSWTQEGTTLHLTVEQVQTNTGLFEMPIAIRALTDVGAFDFRVENALRLETYDLPIEGVVSDVLCDPDGWILKKADSPMVNPTFHAGVLLVNGVDWATYGSEITSAYADSIFQGTLPADFWDTFDEPAGGYPSALPSPLGHGAVPAAVLGRYSTVVWVGNDFQGDLALWHTSAIRGYLEAGGNVLLMTRRGSRFADEPLTDYLGIAWDQLDSSVGSADALHAGLTDLPAIGQQSSIDLFQTAVGPQATLLYRGLGGTAGGRGLGVHAQPPGGGSVRPEGGRFVYLGGRPYRWDHTSLRANVDYILRSLLGEPAPPVVGRPPAAASASVLALAPVAPNPSRGSAFLRFTTPIAGAVRLALYDAAGRLVRTLVEGELPAGDHQIRWDGRDRAGRHLPAGAYYARLESAGEARSRSLVLLR